MHRKTKIGIVLQGFYPRTALQNKVEKSTTISGSAIIGMVGKSFSFMAK
jgi:hypothetical protein